MESQHTNPMTVLQHFLQNLSILEARDIFRDLRYIVRAPDEDQIHYMSRVESIVSSSDDLKGKLNFYLLYAVANANVSKGYQRGSSQKANEVFAKTKKLLDICDNIAAAFEEIDNESNLRLLSLKAQYYTTIGEMEKADVYFQKCFSSIGTEEFQEYHAMVYQGFGLYCCKRGWYSCGIKTLRECLKKVTDEKNCRSSILLSLGDCYVQGKEYENAEKVYSLLADETGDFRPLHYLANLALMKRNYKSAKAYVRRAYEARNSGESQKRMLQNLRQRIKQSKSRRMSKAAMKKEQEEIFEQVFPLVKCKEGPPKWVRNMSRYVRKEKQCAFCKRSDPRKALMKCAACDVTRYCDEVCQRRDWKSHRKICKTLRVDN